VLICSTLSGNPPLQLAVMTAAEANALRATAALWGFTENELSAILDGPLTVVPASGNQAEAIQQLRADVFECDADAVRSVDAADNGAHEHGASEGLSTFNSSSSGLVFTEDASAVSPVQDQLGAEALSSVQWDLVHAAAADLDPLLARLVALANGPAVDGLRWTAKALAAHLGVTLGKISAAFEGAQRKLPEMKPLWAELAERREAERLELQKRDLLERLARLAAGPAVPVKWSRIAVSAHLGVAERVLRAALSYASKELSDYQPVWSPVGARKRGRNNGDAADDSDFEDDDGEAGSVQDAVEIDRDDDMEFIYDASKENIR
jgi:hypothetical protein